MPRGSARDRAPSIAPRPDEIYARAVEEGEHRLSSGTLQLVSRSFIAGFNIVFGIIALAVVYSSAEARALFERKFFD